MHLSAVVTAPLGLSQEVRSTGAGLISAAFVAIVPSYISRSVAGSYDNEGVAIFALMFVFFFYIKARSDEPHAGL